MSTLAYNTCTTFCVLLSPSTNNLNIYFNSDLAFMSHYADHFNTASLQFQQSASVQL